MKKSLPEKSKIENCQKMLPRSKITEQLGKIDDQED